MRRFRVGSNDPAKWRGELNKVGFLTEDDYRYLPWEPAISVSTGSTLTGLAIDLAHYIAIGELVHVVFRITLTIGTADSALITATLPFSVAATGQNQRAIGSFIAGGVPGACHFTLVNESNSMTLERDAGTDWTNAATYQVGGNFGYEREL